MAARSVRDAEVAGSNPAVPTEKEQVRGGVAEEGGPPLLLPWHPDAVLKIANRLSVRPLLLERAHSVPGGRAGAKGCILKRLQRIRGLDRGSSSCDRR